MELLFISVLIYLYVCLCSKIVIFRPTKMASKFEDSTVVYDGEVTSKKIETWVKKNV